MILSAPSLYQHPMSTAVLHVESSSKVTISSFRFRSNCLGRGKESPAYMHALQEDHQLYICLTSLDYKVYQLPENIMIDSPLLADIRVSLLKIKNHLSCFRMKFSRISILLIKLMSN